MTQRKFTSMERTFVMIKPDGVKRGLVGRIYTRLEQLGLKLVTCRMIQASEQKALSHYPGDDREWITNLGEKTFQNYNGDIQAIKADLGTDNKYEIGEKIYHALAKALTDGPVVLMVWEGNHAVAVVRKAAGATIPEFAEPGTIRGDFGFDSPYLAVKSGRIAFNNILHISSSSGEAEREIRQWFGDKYKYLGDYERVDYISSFEAFN